jgi:ferredoxin, 2Fe-2S
MSQVIVSIDGKPVMAEKNSTLSDIFKANDIAVTQFCGGQGVCTACHCLVVGGAAALSKPTEQEQMMFSKIDRPGSRYACQARVVDNGAMLQTTPARVLATKK